MSFFKEAVDADIDSVFVNLDEFAEEHVINRQKVSCVIDIIVTQGRPDSAHLGVFLNQIRIHIREGLIDTPVEGETLYVDGFTFKARSVSREMGMLVITAEKNSQ